MRVHLLLLALLLPGLAQAAIGSTVQELLDLLEGQNPELAAVRFEAEAAGERAQSADALPDPTVRVELMDVTNYEKNQSPNVLPNKIGAAKYTVAQNFPLWGKRDLRRQEAESGQRQAESQRKGVSAELKAQVKAAFARHYLTHQGIRLGEENLELIAHLEKLALVRYGNGLAPQQDAIRAQVEKTALKNELLAQDTERHHARIRLNSLLSRSADAPLAEPRELRPLPMPAKLDAKQMEDRLRQVNPGLQVLDSRIDGLQANRELTEKNRLPDLTVGVSPTWREGKVKQWDLMFEMNLPLWQGARSAQTREAAAMLSAARSRKAATENQARAELHESLSALETARRQEHLVATSLLPQAEVTYKAALSGYETGKVDFATLLDAQRQIRRAKAEQLKLRVEQEVQRANLERLLGEDL